MLIRPKGTNHSIRWLMTRSFGGPTIVGEWSIADTDCALYLNSVGQGYLQAICGLQARVQKSLGRNLFWKHRNCR